MEVTCTKCQAVTVADVAFEATHFSCPSCRSIFKFEQGKLSFERRFSDKSQVDGITVGQKGILYGVEYTVTGIVVKKVYGAYYWREYILVDKEGNFRYLSESEGHWILLRDIDDAGEAVNHPEILEYDEKEFNLYEYTKAEIVTAMGFFDFRLQQEKIPMADYICPPYMLSYESMNGTKSAFIGEHISRRTLARGFKGVYFPYAAGVGVLSPRLVDTRNMAIVFCSVAILMFLSHYFVYNGKSGKTVLDTEISLYSQGFVSPAFDLKGGAAPLSIRLYSNVDNSWASADVALVNEGTGEESYASKDIEYYHGYTDGENWSEGSPSEKFYLCGVAAGKYHLVITPSKAPETTASGMTVKATWDEPSYRNVIWLIALLGLIWFCFYRYDEYTEKQRWADSDHSPYDS